MPDYSYVGKSVQRVDATEKTTGEAVYSSDIILPGMLIGKCKRSPHPFAKILSIDTSKALKLPGVRAVITARNVTQFNYGEYALDQFPLCDQYAYYVGDEVAAVAAIDKDTAAEAIELIEVEYEELEPVFDAEKAMEPGAPAIHPELEEIERNIAYRIDFERGRGEAAFQDADLVLEDRFSTQPMHPCYLQTRDCAASWHSNKLTIWSVMQSPFRMRIPLAKSLGMSEDNIRIIPCTVGGGFGNNAFRLWPITALLAKAASKPVKLVLTREEDFISGRPLMSETIYLKMGFKKDGTMVAKKANLIGNSGAYVGSCRGVLSVSASRPDNHYRLPNIAVSAKLVYTNTIPRGSLRGYGTQIMTFALESMIDMAAVELGMDPGDLRKKNAVQNGDTSVHGLKFNSCGFTESLDLATEKSAWKKPQTKKNGKVSGYGFASAIHVAGNRNVVKLFDGSSALVHVDKLGKARVISGEVDIGQGSETVFAQIAAEELGLGIQDVSLFPVDTDISPFALGTFGDRVTVLGGHAVKMAAADAKRKLIRDAAEILEVNPLDLDLRDGSFFVKGHSKPLSSLEDIAPQIVFKKGGLPVVGQGEYAVPDFVVLTDEKTQYGNYSIAYTFITQIVEVEVDPETGITDVVNVWSAIDLGKAINPKACEAQVEGGIMMGVGYALTENYPLSNGTMLASNFHDYKIASFSNLPQIHSYFIETVDPETPYGAKSIGEAIGDPTAGAVANAVYDAVGVRIKDLPITPEKILNALKEKKAR